MSTKAVVMSVVMALECAFASTSAVAADLALGFEEYAPGTALTEDNCASLILPEGDSADIRIVGHDGNIGYAGEFMPPFTSAGTNGLSVKTTFGKPCAFRLAEGNAGVEISAGRPYCVDFLAKFTVLEEPPETAPYSSYSAANVLSVAPSTRMGAIAVRPSDGLAGPSWSSGIVVVLRKMGFVCYIDDHIMLWQQEMYDDYYDEVVGTNWYVRAGNGVGGISDYVLAAAGDAPLPSGDDDWHRITFKTFLSDDSASLLFNVFIDGQQVRSGDTVDFPSMATGTSIGTVRFAGTGNVDNIVAREVPPPEIRNVTAKQRWPWNGLVDITCEVTGIDERTSNDLCFVVEAVNQDSGITNTLSHFWVVKNGNTSIDLTVRANGNYRLLWDACADFGEVVYSNMVLTVKIKTHDKVQNPAEAQGTALVPVGESEQFMLDTRTGVRESTGEEMLTYSSSWECDADATVTIAQDGVAIAEGLTGEGDYAWGVTRNGIYELAHTTYTNGVAGAVETATFVVTGKDVPFAPGDVTVTSYSNKYDGAAHGITVASEIEGIGYKYAYGSLGTTSPTSGWSTEVSTLTDVGSMVVWVEVSAPGYITETNSATVTISKRSATVTVTGRTAEYVYDGSEKCVEGFDLATDDGLYDFNTKTYFGGVSFSARRTDAGMSYMGLLASQFANDDKNFNVTYVVTDGWLRITQATNAWIEEPSILGWMYGQQPSEPNMGEAKFGTATVSYGMSGTTRPASPGHYVATFAIAETANFTGLEKTVAFDVSISGEGTVTPPKSWKTGQKVTWTATAAKGSVFAHWEGALVESLGLSRNELRNPSLQFVVPAGFDASQVSAVFVSIDDDGLRELSFRDGNGQPVGDEDGILLNFGEPVELWLVDDSKSYVTATLSGLPAGLKFDAKTLKVSGTPTKRSVYWVQVKAKNASGYQWSEKVRMAVSGYTTEPNEPNPTRAAYYPLTVSSSDPEKGTVSGTGVYAEGKKVSISAKPAKGHVFAGWYCDAALAKPMEFASGDYRKASQSVVIPEARYIFAKFVEATVAYDPIVGLAATGSGLVAESCFKWCVGVAVPEGDGIEYASASLPSASAAKLPAGVKFDAAKGRFAGVPTKAGTYEATITVKNASKSTDVLKLTIVVDPLPAWAVGSFEGEVGNGESASAEATADKRGTVSLTVATSGKISGKMLEGGRTWTLSAGEFSHVEQVDVGDVFYATVVGKAGKEVVTNMVVLGEEYGVGVVSGVVAGDAPLSWTAWQNLWKRADTKAAQPVFRKSFVVERFLGEPGDKDNMVAATFKSGGAVSFSGKVGGVAVSGSSQLAWNGEGWQVTLYAPPKKGFDGWCETFDVELTHDEENNVTAVEIGDEDKK